MTTEVTLRKCKCLLVEILNEQTENVTEAVKTRYFGKTKFVPIADLREGDKQVI
jgi:hypothetical protein